MSSSPIASSSPPRRRSGLRLTPRDFEIIELLFQHRYADVNTVHMVFGTDSDVASRESKSGLARRVRKLVAARYLKIADAARPILRGIEGGYVYALAPKGAALLHAHHGGDPAYAVSPRTLERQNQYAYVAHEVGVALFLSAIQRMANRWPGDRRLVFAPIPHYAREGLDEMCREARVNPDGFFTLGVAGGVEAVPHFVEYDRGTLDPMRVLVRYERYVRWLRGRDVRVLTVTSSPSRMARLRDGCAALGRDHLHPRAWQGLFFTVEGEGGFEPKKPSTVFDRIFRFADGTESVSLVDRFRATHP